MSTRRHRGGLRVGCSAVLLCGTRVRLGTGRCPGLGPTEAQPPSAAGSPSPRSRSRLGLRSPGVTCLWRGLTRAPSGSGGGGGGLCVSMTTTISALHGHLLDRLQGWLLHRPRSQRKLRAFSGALGFSWAPLPEGEESHGASSLLVALAGAGGEGESSEVRGGARGRLSAALKSRSEEVSDRSRDHARPF